MGDKRHEWVRDGAVAAVVAIGRPALKALKKGISDHDQTYRKSVYESIGKIGEDAKKLVPELTKAMYARWRGESYDIAGALAGIGKPSVRPLVKMLKSDESQIRIAAAWGLGRIGTKAKLAIRDLERLLDDEFDSVREQARKALNRIRN